MKEIMTIAEKAAREAGALLLDNFGKKLTIEKKADKSLVTDIDKKSEMLIKDIIHATYPDHNILGEESGLEQNGGEYTWVLDPIDGTHNFIRGIEMFGVSIGVIRKEEFFAGVIYLPCEDSLYAAERGCGTFKNEKKISVSNYSTPDQCTLVFDSGFKNEATKKIDAFKTIAPEMFNVRMFGASVRNLTYVADGIADALMEFDDNLWDYAAGVMLVMEAGGKVTDYNGNPLKPGGREYLASNGVVHESILKLLR
jgi:myo-inositol-1(or 4)-monophosphatase